MRSRNIDFACAVVIVGLLAGCAGLATSLLLRSIEHLTYHYTFGSLLQAVTASSLARVALGPMIGGGTRRAGLVVSPVAGRCSATLVGDRDRVNVFACCRSASMRLLQVLVVGSGASLGRERCTAPAGRSAREISRRVGSSGCRRRIGRLLLACAAGAGLGAVYAVPLGGDAVLAANHVEDLASPRGRCGIDHLQSGRRRRLVRDAQSAEPELAQRARRPTG